jgi:hypothetical protein
MLGSYRRYCRALCWSATPCVTELWHSLAWSWWYLAFCAHDGVLAGRDEEQADVLSGGYARERWSNIIYDRSSNNTCGNCSCKHTKKSEYQSLLTNSIRDTTPSIYGLTTHVFDRCKMIHLGVMRAFGGVGKVNPGRN